jgi:hypothetical protein
VRKATEKNDILYVQCKCELDILRKHSATSRESFASKG